jgi:hypothetical protein
MKAFDPAYRAVAAGIPTLLGATLIGKTRCNSMSVLLHSEGRVRQF